MVKLSIEKMYLKSLHTIQNIKFKFCKQNKVLQKSCRT